MTLIVKGMAPISVNTYLLVGVCVRISYDYNFDRKCLTLT